MKQLLVFLLLLCSASVSAQDVIVKKDGSTIVCRVVELTSSEIVYKKWSNLNGSNYVMNRADASAINYENGKKVNLSEATNLYTPNNQNDGTQQYNDKALLRIYAATEGGSIEKARKLKAIGIAGGCLLAITGSLFFTELFGDDFVIYPYIGGSCIGLGVAWTSTFLLLSNHEKKNSQMLESSSLYQYDFQLSNGSSLTLGADLIRDNTLRQNTIGFGLRYKF